MSKPFTRRALLGGMGSAIASTAVANAPLRSLRPVPRGEDFAKRRVRSVSDLIEMAGLGGKVGFAVADARTGAMLEVHNPLRALPPASVAKAITARYALSVLGANHRFSTKLLATGQVENGVLGGDLVLVGGGDPTLDTNALYGLVASLKEKGVSRVAGRFLVEANALPYQHEIDPGQPDHLGYNPAISGLNLNFNRVHFEWKRAGESYSVAMDARSDKFKPAVSMAKMRIVDRKVPVFTYEEASGVDNWTVARAALGSGGSRWLPVRRPDLYAGEVFHVLAKSEGVSIDRPEFVKTADGALVAEHMSADLSSIVRGMLKYSTNLTAEVAGLSASLALGGPSSSLDASGALMSDWSKSNIGLRHISFSDHSGLSDTSRISANDMLRALNHDGPDGDLNRLMKVVQPRDEKGRVAKDAPYTIRAKTGTLNFVSSLSGYLTAPSGRPLAFAIFTADLDRRAAIPRALRERPEGAKSWARRSRNLQQRLLERWAVLYDT